MGREQHRPAVVAQPADHLLDEAEQLADYVSIMRAGQIVIEGTVPQIVAGEHSTISFANPGRALPALPALTEPPREDRGRINLRSSQLQSTLSILLRWADEQSVLLADLAVASPSLEQAFLRIAREPTPAGGDVDEDPRVATAGGDNAPGEPTLEGVSR